MSINNQGETAQYDLISRGATRIAINDCFVKVGPSGVSGYEERSAHNDGVRKCLDAVEALPAVAADSSQGGEQRKVRDWTVGDIIAAYPDGTIVLDDGLTTWNDVRAKEFLEKQAASMKPETVEAFAEVAKTLGAESITVCGGDRPGVEGGEQELLPREFDHFSIVPFKAICGADVLNQSTTQTPERAKCATCWFYWKEFITTRSHLSLQPETAELAAELTEVQRQLREYGGIRCTNVCDVLQGCAAAHWCLLAAGHDDLDHVHYCDVAFLRTRLESDRSESSSQAAEGQVWDEAINWIRDRWLAAYPVEVFPEPPPYPAECSRDVISAAMGRHMATQLIKEFESFKSLAQKSNRK